MYEYIKLCSNQLCGIVSNYVGICGVVSVSVVERHIAHKPSELRGNYTRTSRTIIYIYNNVGELCRNNTMASI